jgi:hypothetical protein
MKAVYLLAPAILLLAFAAPAARAQTPQSTPNINDPVMRFPSSDRVKSPIETRTRIPVEPALPPDTLESLGPYTVRVRVRYREAYGYLYSDTYDNNRPFSCIAFAAKATVRVGAPGTFGSDKSVGVLTSHSPMREGNGYYSCWYTFTELPIERSITFSAPVVNMQQYLTARWLGGTEPQPAAGYWRVVTGNRSVLLKYNQPGVTVDLEMVYRPLPSQPR